MNRRGFFGSLAAIAATAVLDPERLLWVPGKKLISIPAPRPIYVIRIEEVRDVQTHELLGVHLVEAMTRTEYRRRYPRAVIEG